MEPQLGIEPRSSVWKTDLRPTLRQKKPPLVVPLLGTLCWIYKSNVLEKGKWLARWDSNPRPAD